jgi:nucleosome binding factor SPN SPT16 subunit
VAEITERLDINKLPLYDSERLAKYDKKLLQVDEEFFSVIFPIFGQRIPIHIACIRNITKHTEKQDLILRVNFHNPLSVTSHIIFPSQPELKNNPIYIKELSFRTQNQDQCVKVLKQIKDLQKAYRLKCSIEQK